MKQIPKGNPAQRPLIPIALQLGQPALKRADQPAGFFFKVHQGGALFIQLTDISILLVPVYPPNRKTLGPTYVRAGFIDSTPPFAI